MGTWIYRRLKGRKEQGAGLLSNLSPGQDLNYFKSGLGLIGLDLGQVWTKFGADLDEV